MNRLLLCAIALVSLVAKTFSGGILPPQVAAPIRESRTGMEFIRIAPGTFRMGCSVNDGQCDADEKPTHEVRIAREFQIGRYEVTQAQWRSVMSSNPSFFKSDDRPVENVSWNDAAEFLAKMTAGTDGFRYRLPTEAEWEYAARAGATGPWGADSLETIAWSGSSSDKTMPVGQKKPNAWGLYDTEGNVWEWTADWYGNKTYEGPAVDNPAGPPSGDFRVLRGGAWGLPGYYARLSFRDGNEPSFKDSSSGFRAVREAR